ncbi:homocysteine S-methyltransferase [Nocardioides sp.]|uniref:homocysteine S-methyltransferase n=1 Tax=Nocardioides sp. TaxID=35761 RepID=UPI003D12B847
MFPDLMILDGGLSNALEDRGLDLSSQLWTARLLRDAPEEIAAVHRDYFAAGARVATSASYQASVPSLVSAGMERQEAEGLITASVAIAQQARDEFQAQDAHPLLVAASVGPYGAVLADGSEYRGRYGLSAAQLREFHLPRLDLLAAAGPDLFAVETIPDADEAAVLVALLDEIGLPAWFAYSVEGERTRAGQPLTEAYAVLADSSAVQAVGLNCSAPDQVLPALRIAAEVTGRPGVAYPNKGEDWDSASGSWRGTAQDSTPLALDWVAAGAQLVGGCCRVGPADIARLAQLLD